MKLFPAFSALYLYAMTVVDLRMTVELSVWLESATMMNSESVMFILSSKTGPLLSTRGARREITPADGYSGSSCWKTCNIHRWQRVRKIANSPMSPEAKKGSN